MNSVTTFITVLSGWSIFLSGMTGILIFDYFCVRRGELHMGDLYRGGKAGAYWYVCGVNWRVVVAWGMGVWPLLRMFTLPFPFSHFPLSLDSHIYIPLTPSHITAYGRYNHD